MEINKIYQGDCLEVLKTFPDECIDMVITSPPYFGLRIYLPKDHLDYQKQIGLEESFEEYQNRLLAVITEIKRVLKPMGQFWLNMGDCYASNGSLETRFWHGDNVGKHKLSNDNYAGRARIQNYPAKCLLMMPERIALKMIDNGWILRNKIKWAKQVLIKKKNRTIGSVMPTSVKDRFNESGEEFYLFVKNKKYYSDLDAVRLNIQTFEDREMGIDREKGYPNAKRNKFAFNYRVRDAKRKKGQPQFKASEKEIKRYNEIPEDYGKKKLQNLPDKGKTLNRWMSGTPNYTYQGKFAGKQDAEMFNSPRARTQRQQNAKEQGMHTFYSHSKRFKSGEYQSTTNFFGKNIPSVWLIGPEPHNWERELGLEGIDHFAIFPKALCEIPIKFGCPKDGIVFDPFMGSGTTLVVAKKLGRKYVGIELNPDYIKIAEKRISQITKPLF